MDTYYRGNKTTGWMTLASSTRQLDNGEDRLEEKLDNWLDDISCTQYRNLIYRIMEMMDYKGKE